MKSIVIPALLVLLAATILPAQAQRAVPVVGRDYIEIPDGSPLDSTDGTVVVEEFFNYICPGCNSFEPYFAKWTTKLPSYVTVVHIPAAFRPDFAQYARAYYAAQQFNLVDQTHAAVYDAIHRTHILPAEGDRPDDGRIAAFYAKYGADEQEFLAAMKSFAVDVKIRRATDHMRSSKVPSTPAVVINGRYLVKGRTYADILRTAEFLIEKEHAQ